MAIKTFTTGEVLTASDTNTYLNNGGLVFIQQSSIAASSVAIDGCFTNTYANYRIVVNVTGGAGGAAQVQMGMRIGGVTTAGVLYYYYFRANAYTGAAGDQPAAGVGNWFNLRTNGTSFGGVIDIQNPNLDKRTHFSSAGSDTAQAFTCAGYHDSTTQFDGFALTNSGANSMTGTVRVYGYRQS